MDMRALAKKLYHYLPRPPSTNLNLRRLRGNPYDRLAAGATVLDLGAKRAKGCYAFGRPPADITVVSLDIESNAGVDVMADAHRLPFSADTIDAVFCVSTLEHVHRPPEVIKEICRVLKPGGIVYVNAPFVFPFHADPDDFHRFSQNGLRVLCNPFVEIQSGFNRGPASTICHLLVHFGAVLFCFNRKWIYGLLVDLFQWCFFWIKYLDYLIGRYDLAKVLHSGSFFLGRKPDHRMTNSTA